MVQHQSADTPALMLGMYAQVQHMCFRPAEHDDSISHNGIVLLIDPATVTNAQAIAEDSNCPRMLVGRDFNVNDSAQVSARHYENNIAAR